MEVASLVSINEACESTSPSAINVVDQGLCNAWKIDETTHHVHSSASKFFDRSFKQRLDIDRQFSVRLHEVIVVPSPPE